MFDAPVGSPPTSMRYFGFLVPRTAPGAPSVVEFPPGVGPTVLVSLGTTSQGQQVQLERIVDALDGTPTRAIVTTAGQAALTSTRNVVVADYVPHAQVLPETDLMITHAGMGSVAAAVDAGIPMVCCPYDRDQPLNAERVAALGVGVTAGDDLAAAVELVLGDPSFRARARELARAQSCGGRRRWRRPRAGGPALSDIASHLEVTYGIGVAAATEIEPGGNVFRVDRSDGGAGGLLGCSRPSAGWTRWKRMPRARPPRRCRLPG